MSYGFLKLRLNCSNGNETVVAFEKIIVWQTYLKKQGVGTLILVLKFSLKNWEMQN